MVVSPWQFRKAFSPIFVTESGITVEEQPIIKVFVSDSIIALQLLCELKCLLLLSTTMEHKLELPPNAHTPIILTWDGITIEEKPHEKKAFQPMLLTLSGIMRFPSFLHSKKAILPIAITPSGIEILSKALSWVAYPSLKA